MITLTQLSSLAKVFPDKIYGDTSDRGQCAKDTAVSYQIAILGEKGEYSYKIDSPLEDKIRVYRVGYVPSVISAYPHAYDDNYLATEAGLFPDPLFPLDGSFSIVDDKYLTLWINISIEKDAVAGEYPISISIFKDGTEVGMSTYILKICDCILPEQSLIFTQWFHTDCIADVHGTEVFSPLHWELIERYVSLASEHGMNMILTPVLTPPLDTEVGGERTTVQLAKIEKSGDGYVIDLSRLERFIDLCLDNGIIFFEINHFFTQWGAKSAPKVIATVDGEEKRIFGWETDATSEEYRYFLKCLVPEIIAAFEKKGVDRRRLYFHVSDEPNGEQLDSYRRAGEGLIPLIEGCNHMDALSHFEFYKERLVPTPVVATSALEPFMEAEVPGLWCYYCCAQAREVANRFFSMPSARSRIIGIQMYKHGIVGFLHWGYNFYNTQYSKMHINPYEVTDAGGAFPSGDAFSVYPYGNTAIPSLRQKVFKEAIDDMRLLKLLEEKVGKDRVNEIIGEIAEMDITFKHYPKDEEFFVRLSDRIFLELEK
ncbi:MAG: DUF4091 domain-containing protein [Clostridia bacterium]|nr:DUF4091 domain-containing protein [Clostridia bacterium]